MHRTRNLIVCFLASLLVGHADGSEFDYALTDYAIYVGRDAAFRERANVTGHLGVGRDLALREDGVFTGGIFLGRDFYTRERFRGTGWLVAGRDVFLRHDCVLNDSIQSGRRITIQSRTHVTGDVTAKEWLSIDPSATIDGQRQDYTDPEHTWIQESVTFPSFSPGTQDLSLAQNQTHDIAPGQYRDLNVQQNCTLRLRTGDYHFRNVSLRENIIWEIDETNGPVNLHVSYDMATRENTRFEPSSGTASNFFLWVGRGLSFRENNKFTGQIRVVRDVSLRENFQMTGTIYAERDFAARENLRIKNSTPPPTYFVRTRGSDANDGLSPQTPFRTIQKAIDQCSRPGSKVYIGPGTYRESLVVGSGTAASVISGTESVPIQIIGDTEGEYTYDAPGEIFLDGLNQRDQAVAWQGVENWKMSNINFVNFVKNNIMLSSGGIHLQNCGFKAGTGYVMYASATGDITVEGCTVDRDQSSGHLFWIIPNNKTSPTSVKITRNDMTLKDDMYMRTGLQDGWSAIQRRSWNTRYTYGIVVFGWGQPKLESVEISNNQISDCYLPIYSGVYSSNTASSLIANNTVTGSFYSIYSYAYNTHSTLVINNIIDSAYYGMMSYSYGGKAPVISGLMENSITSDMSRYRRAFEGSIIQGSPMFADAPAGDFSLLPGSPAIDAGTLTNAPLIDIAGRTRPSDGDNDGLAQIDIGAYELVNAPTRVKVVEWREIGVDGHR